MPANLTPEYYKAEKEYRAARTPAERLACLQTMLRVIPKHKGTDHMQADLKRRIARLRQEAEKSSRSGKRAPVFKVEKEGAGQLVLLGAPNAGKSAIVAALTNANVTVADYPYSTPLPVPGMAAFEDIQIQLVDTPPVSEDFMESWIPDTVRRADGTLLVADLGHDGLLEDTQAILDRLDSVKITLVREMPEDPEELSRHYHRAVILANKCDLPGAEERLDILGEFFGDHFDIWPVSATGGQGMEELPRRMFEFLRIIRVYTKEPGEKPDMDQPYTVPIGTTVIELATKVHREFEETLKSARVWGSGKYDGIAVKRDHVLQDGDIVELQE